MKGEWTWHPKAGGWVGDWKGRAVLVKSRKGILDGPPQFPPAAYIIHHEERSEKNMDSNLLSASMDDFE